MLVVCLTLGLVLSPRLREAAGLTPRGDGDYVVGGRVDVPDELFASAPGTLLLFLQSSCASCVKHEAGLKHLVAALSGAPVRLVMVTGRGRLDDEYGFAARLGLAPSQVVPLELRRLRLRHVPMLVLVDRAGTVRQVLRPEEFESGLDRFEAAAARSLSD